MLALRLPTQAQGKCHAGLDIRWYRRLGHRACAEKTTEFAWPSANYLILIGFLQAFIYQGVFISFIASSMNLCWVKVSATQFAIYMAWANLGRSFGAGSLAALENTFSYNQMFFIIGLTFFVGVVLVWLTHFDRHREEVRTLGHMDEVGDFAPHG